MSNNLKTEQTPKKYVVGFSGTEVDDVKTEFVYGTEDDVKAYLQRHVQELKSEDPEGFDFDTLERTPAGRLHGSIVFDHCHYDFSATPMDLFDIRDLTVE